MALGFMLVISIALVTALELSRSGQRASNFSRADRQAVATAEAGLNQAQAVLANSSTPGSASALPASCASSPVVSAEGGTACYFGSLDTAADPDTWTVTSVSTVASPSGGAALNHTTTAKFQVVPGMVGNEAWNYVYSDAPGCTYYQNNVEVRAPIYTKGDLCLKNGALALGERVDVYGGIQLENSGRVGTSASDSSDPAVRSRLGCRNGSSPSWPTGLTCLDSTFEVYRSSFSNSTPNLTKPPFDATKRNTAMPGPFQPCTTWSGSVPSFTTTGAVDLMPTSSYTCQVTISGNLVGELSWDNTTKVLTVLGTIWFDGELIMSGTQQGQYAGEATIYVAKKVNVSNSTELCATSDCTNTGWDPNANLLVIATAATDVPAFELQSFAKYQGGIYTVGGFKMQNNAEMRGPVIGDAIDVQNNGLPESWPPLNSLLAGMPQNPAQMSAVYVPGSWRG